jgi:hypothetical protein
MNRWNLYAMAVALAMSAMPATGDVILGIGSVFAAPGSSGGTIEVDVQNTGGADLVIGGFNFAISGDSDIDFTAAGFSTLAPYIFTGDSFDQANALPLNTSTGPSLSASDISNSGNGDVLGAGQTAGLALVTFNVSSTAPSGPVTISFSTDPMDTNLSDPNGNPITIDTFVSGTINVVPANTLPEPSAAAMLLATLMGFGASRLAKHLWRTPSCVQHSRSSEPASLRTWVAACLAADRRDCASGRVTMTDDMA